MLGLLTARGAAPCAANLARHSALFAGHRALMRGAASAAVAAGSDIFSLSSLPDDSAPLPKLFKDQPEMPVTDRVTRAILALSDRPDFSDKRFILLQHGMQSMLPEIAALLHLGAKPERIHFLPKLYSRHPQTMLALEDAGIKVYANRSPGSHGRIDATYYIDVIELVSDVRRHAEKDPDKGMVVLADGLTFHASTAVSGLGGRIFCVEQTSRGLQSRHTKGSRLSYMSIADCLYKTALESHVVCDAVMRSVLENPELEAKLKPGSVHGVAGRGALGRRLAEILSKKYGCIVFIYDKNEALMPTTDNGVRRANSMVELFGRVDTRDGILFGATGAPIIDDQSQDALSPAQLENFEHVTCVSVSSGDVEFRGALLAYAALMNGETAGMCAEEFLQTVRLPTGIGHIEIFRGGTPANFNNGLFSVSPSLIDPTRALMGPIGATIAAMMLELGDDSITRGVQTHYRVPARLQKLVIDAAAESSPEFAHLVSAHPEAYTLEAIDRGSGPGAHLPGDSLVLDQIATADSTSPLANAASDSTVRSGSDLAGHRRSTFL